MRSELACNLLIRLSFASAELIQSSLIYFRSFIYFSKSKLLSQCFITFYLLRASSSFFRAVVCTQSGFLLTWDSKSIVEKLYRSLLSFKQSIFFYPSSTVTLFFSLPFFLSSSIILCICLRYQFPIFFYSYSERPFLPPFCSKEVIICSSYLRLLPFTWGAYFFLTNSLNSFCLLRSSSLSILGSGIFFLYSYSCMITEWYRPLQ